MCLYCVIQKVKNKKQNPYGAHKELLVDNYSYSNNGGATKTKYTYKYSSERFERPKLDAYKISIHKSYRENGTVKKKQWVICTMGYYDLLDSWAGDHLLSSTLRTKLSEMCISEEELWEIIYQKLDPIIESVKKEFEQTEEYITKQQHDEILRKYRETKSEFEKKYGSDSYDYSYDIFGELRNAEYLKQLEQQYKAQQEYKERSYRAYEQGNYKGSGYYGNNYSNYNNSGYYGSNRSNYTEDEKKRLKKMIKVLSMKFHPDVEGGDEETMKLVNKLKEEWGV